MKALTTAAVLSLCSKHALALSNGLTHSRELTSQVYQESITIDGLLAHAKKWQEFADRANGTRSFDTKGYKLSADYVHDLAKSSGYKVTRQTVKFPQSTIRSQELEINHKVFGPGEVIALINSPPTPKEGINASLALVLDEPSTFTGPGCNSDDYDGLDVRKAVVFMSSSGCTFATKSAVAKRAGALGVVIYNDVPGKGPIQGQISSNASENLPTVMIGYDDAQEYIKILRADEFPERVAITMKVDSSMKVLESYNIIAQTQWGNKDNVIHVGAHLDSVPAGPGINDNGSGSAAIAELLVQLAKLKSSVNAVRFSWWTNGENGSIGSKHYIDSLSGEERKKIAMYINVDTIASPNYIYGIHDGSNSSEFNTIVPPPGSAALERLFQADFESKNIPWAIAGFTSSSDYDAFAKVGIPVGGLVTGGDGIKSEAQAAKFGGQAGVPFDKCYHQTCDTIDNLAKDAFLVNARSIAHVIATAANSTAVVDAERAVGGVKVKA
ncbi:putative aminopeptidase [Rhizoctonia solani AG-1 IB]|uniref:Peptide hydrolase n=1 Tax=Thanatephorus cucumeris (strain AG1-IB / isolate 7/3/14) TaxID=1108050 RepID=A0A0B7FII8_THACB|nr:putative aminopeptidase [Rhizoctonia solani AG-1 IB]